MVSGLSALGFDPNAPATGHSVCKPVTPRPFDGNLYLLSFQYICRPSFPSWLNGNPPILFPFIPLRTLSSPTGGYTPLVYPEPSVGSRAVRFRLPCSSSAAKGFEEGFFLFLSELGERIEGVVCSPQSSRKCASFHGTRRSVISRRKWWRV
jgi:hypothetical protein